MKVGDLVKEMGYGLGVVVSTGSHAFPGGTMVQVKYSCHSVALWTQKKHLKVINESR
jgi:hypothetical protein